jgi:hypothetical protein
MIVENKPNNGEDLINMRREIYGYFRYKTNEFNTDKNNNYTLNLYKATD